MPPVPRNCSTPANANISLPQPSLELLSYFLTYPSSPLPFLVRTLLDRPDLASRVATLHLWVQDRRLIKVDGEPDLRQGHPHYDTFKRASAQLSRMEATFAELVNWSKELYQFQKLALHAILISLLHQFRELKIYAPAGLRTMFLWDDPHGRERSKKDMVDYSYLDVALRSSKVTALHVGFPYPIKQFPSASLAKVEFDILFLADRLDLLDGATVLNHVHTVCVTINIPLLRFPNLACVFRKLDARLRPQIFLRDAVPNLRTFSVNPTRGTMRITYCGNTFPAFKYLEDSLQDIETMPCTTSMGMLAYGTSCYKPWVLSKTN